MNPYMKFYFVNDKEHNEAYHLLMIACDHGYVQTRMIGYDWTDVDSNDLQLMNTIIAATIAQYDAMKPDEVECKCTFASIYEEWDKGIITVSEIPIPK